MFVLNIHVRSLQVERQAEKQEPRPHNQCIGIVSWSDKVWIITQITKRRQADAVVDTSAELIKTKLGRAPGIS